MLSMQLVYDFQPGTADPRISDLTPIGRTAFFTAADAIHGTELWKSNGTSAGTELVKDIQPGPSGSSPTQLTDVNGTLFFRAGGRLWKSDGTANGTVPISSQADPGPFSPSEFTVHDGSLYFRATDPVHGSELWRSDGTSSGTFRIRDIRPGKDGSVPRGLTALGKHVYFIASIGVNQYALFQSDGTQAGTVPVQTINPGLGGPPPTQLVNVGETLYFTSFDVTHGARLWKSDGTRTGTVPLAAGFTDVLSQSLFPAQDAVYFTAFDPVHGWELWNSNGTSVGTRMVRDINPGFAGSSPAELMESGGTLYFTATTATSGKELWTTDGTVGGTRMVRDIRPGPEGASPAGLRNIGGIVVFAADDGAHGTEIWRSDATREGTRLFLDVNHGKPSSLPAGWVRLDGRLLFHADDGQLGTALWSYVESKPGTPIPQAPVGVATFPYPTFRWAAVEGAIAYDLWVNDLTTRRSGIIRNPAIAENRFPSPVPLLHGHRFIWTVRAVGRFGTWGEWAPHRTFHVDSRVDAPNLIGPRGATPTESLTFSWTPVFGANRYDIWVNDQTTGESGIIRHAFVRGTTYVPPASLPSNHSYIWTVRAIDRFGTPGHWAAHAVFSTVAELPVPDLISPIADVLSDGRPKFAWTPVEGAARYDLWVNNLTTKRSGIIRNAHVPEASFVSDKQLPLGHRFIWTVRAIDAAGRGGGWAAHRVFTLHTLPAPTLQGPGPAAASSIRPTFTWSAIPHAAHYELWVNDLTTGQSAVIRNRQIAENRFTAPFNLVAGHRYIWTVRAIDAHGAFGQWATHRTFSVAARHESEGIRDKPAVSASLTDAVLAGWSSTEWWDEKRTFPVPSRRSA